MNSCYPNQSYGILEIKKNHSACFRHYKTNAKTQSKPQKFDFIKHILYSIAD